MVRYANFQDQESALKTLPDIVVATPGRIIDILRNSLSISLDDLGVLILDEADRLLDVAFSGEIRELVININSFYFHFYHHDLLRFFLIEGDFFNFLLEKYMKGR